MYSIFMNWLFMLGIEKDFHKLKQCTNQYLAECDPEDYVIAGVLTFNLKGSDYLYWNDISDQWSLFLENYQLDNEV